LSNFLVGGQLILSDLEAPIYKGQGEKDLLASGGRKKDVLVDSESFASWENAFKKRRRSDTPRGKMANLSHNTNYY